MRKLKNFFNMVSNNNRIFTAEDIGEMSRNEYAQNEKAILHQLQNLGVPRRNQLNQNPDVVYVNSFTKADGTQVKAHYRSKNGGIMSGAAANLTGIDKEFDRPLNVQIKDVDTGIPNYKSYEYYNNVSDKLDHEVGDFLKNSTNAPQVYSNDLRHQFVSAIFARNLGQKQAKWLGDLNEWKPGGTTGSGVYDTELDQLNNEIGRQYAQKYPNASREQLLQILLNDWYKNSQWTENILKKRK